MNLDSSAVASGRETADSPRLSHVIEGRVEDEIGGTR